MEAGDEQHFIYHVMELDLVCLMSHCFTFVILFV